MTSESEKMLNLSQEFRLAERITNYVAVDDRMLAEDVVTNHVANTDRITNYVAVDESDAGRGCCHESRG
jgi:hypothetical protein